MQLPNLLTVRVAAGSSVNALWSASNANGESEDTGAETVLLRFAAGLSENTSRSTANRESAGLDALIVLVELSSNTSTQLANS